MFTLGIIVVSFSIKLYQSVPGRVNQDNVKEDDVTDFTVIKSGVPGNRFITMLEVVVPVAFVAFTVITSSLPNWGLCSENTTY